jgi:hypothetical protein
MGLQGLLLFEVLAFFSINRPAWVSKFLVGRMDLLMNFFMQFVGGRGFRLCGALEV